MALFFVCCNPTAATDGETETMMQCFSWLLQGNIVDAL
jgi:hypothetical protein